MPEFAVHATLSETGKRVAPVFVEADNILKAWEAAKRKSPILTENVWGNIEQLVSAPPEAYPLKETNEMVWGFKHSHGHLLLDPFEGYKEKLVGHCCRCFVFGPVTKEINLADGSWLTPRIPLCAGCKAKDPWLKEAMK